MKFFTPDLLERFGSEDDGVAFAAQEELEQRAEKYAAHLKAVASKLPARFVAMQDHYYLHDARVVEPAFSWFLSLPFQTPCQRWPSLVLVLQLDSPPQEFLVLHYRFATIDEYRRHPSLAEDGLPYLEWRHDEVELLPTEEHLEFGHSILFTNGFELRIRFQDFDFATLEPMRPPTELSHRARVPSHP